MANDEIERFIAENTWRVAKTMPDNPHAYVVRAKCSDEKAFCDFVVHIRKHGYRVKSLYTCFDVGEYRYWTMGAPLNTTIILNRAKNDPPLPRV